MGMLLALAFVVFIFFVVAKTKADARMTAVDARNAVGAVESGRGGRMPSWSVREADTLAFFGGVQMLAQQSRVPEPFIQHVFSETEPSRKLLLAAGEMEASGRSLKQQQVAVSDLLESMWFQLSQEERLGFESEAPVGSMPEPTDRWTYICTEIGDYVCDYRFESGSNGDWEKEQVFERTWEELIAEKGYRVLTLEGCPSEKILNAFTSWGAPIIRWQDPDTRLSTTLIEGLFEDEYCYQRAEKMALGTR